MDPQNDYQFIMIPQQLASCLDANCHKMLSTLIGLDSILSKEDGWFYRSNRDLQLDVRFSQNLVIATLDTLYQAGIINVDCVGKGRGHRSNRIHINFESFKVYEQYSFNDIRNNPDLWIETVPYKNHYTPSYCKDEGKEIGKTIGKGIGKKVTTNIDTTDTLNTSNTIETIDNNIENIEYEKCKESIMYFVHYHNNYQYILLSYNKDKFMEKYRDSVVQLEKNIELKTGSTVSNEVILNYLYDYVQETGVIH